jgi:acyl dehydratase
MYYEDFKVGRLIQVGSRQVTVEDLDAFIRLVGLDNRMFLSDEGARQAGHPARLVPGPLQLSLAMGLCQQAGLFDQVVAVAQFKELNFLKPVHPGDTLTMTALPLKSRPTKDPSRGLVLLRYEIVNQKGQTVLTADGTYLFLTKNKA